MTVSIDHAALCMGCGACCAYSANWPRFSIESDEALAHIPRHLVNDHESGMRCVNDRCLALQGVVGDATACAIYAWRPEVCRWCAPGDDECTLARRKFGLPAL